MGYPHSVDQKGFDLDYREASADATSGVCKPTICALTKSPDLNFNRHGKKGGYSIENRAYNKE